MGATFVNKTLLPSPAQPSPSQPSSAQHNTAQPSSTQPAQPSPSQPSLAQPNPTQPSTAQTSIRLGLGQTRSLGARGARNVCCTTHWGDGGKTRKYLGPYHHPRATWKPWRSPCDTCISLTILKRCSTLLKMYQETIKRLSVAGSPPCCAA